MKSRFLVLALFLPVLMGGAVFVIAYAQNVPAAPNFSPPGGVKAISSCAIKLDWAQTGMVDSFELRQSQNPTVYPYNPKILTPGTLRTYSDVNLPPGATYYYQMKSFAGTNGSLLSQPVQTATTPSIPAAPALQKAQGKSQGQQIELNWSVGQLHDGSTFEISRAVSNNGGQNFSAYSVIEPTLPSTFTSYVDGVPPSYLDSQTVYKYKLRTNEFGCAAAVAASVPYSNEFVVPKVPTGLARQLRAQSEYRSQSFAFLEPQRRSELF